MSIEYRPVCPSCGRPLVYQPSIKSYRCNPCAKTIEADEAQHLKQVEIEVFP